MRGDAWIECGMHGRCTEVEQGARTEDIASCVDECECLKEKKIKESEEKIGNKAEMSGGCAEGKEHVAMHEPLGKSFVLSMGTV